MKTEEDTAIKNPAMCISVHVASVANYGTYLNPLDGVDRQGVPSRHLGDLDR